MKHSSVLFVGDTQHIEFRAAALWLEQRANVVYAKTLSAARGRCLSSETGFDLIVLGAARPGQFLAEEVDALRRTAPLARLLALLGSWCEGELRSGHPWPGVYRTYWHQWPARLAPELENLLDGKCPVWGHALTMTLTEEVLHMWQAPVQVIFRLIVVHASDQETANSLRDVCRHLGYATVCAVGEQPPEVFGAAAVVWDASQQDDSRWQQLRRLSQHYQPTQILATLSFPRSNVVQRLLDSGAHQVLSKPFLLHDFSWLLNQMIQSAPAIDSETAA